MIEGKEKAARALFAYFYDDILMCRATSMKSEDSPAAILLEKEVE